MFTQRNTPRPARRKDYHGSFELVMNALLACKSRTAQRRNPMPLRRREYVAQAVQK